jgi:hypothetical protein
MPRYYHFTSKKPQDRRSDGFGVWFWRLFGSSRKSKYRFTRVSRTSQWDFVFDEVIERIQRDWLIYAIVIAFSLCLFLLAMSQEEFLKKLETTKTEPIQIIMFY